LNRVEWGGRRERGRATEKLGDPQGRKKAVIQNRGRNRLITTKREKVVVREENGGLL